MDNIEHPNTEEVNPQIKIGDTLKQARLAHGFSIEQAAEHLHLSPKLVEQLEADDYQLGRSLVFTRGYVRAYAKFLGLDVNQLMQALDTLHLPEHVVIRTSKGPLFRDVKGRMFSVKTASMVILAVLAFMIILGWQMGDDETQKRQATSVISPYTMGNTISVQSTPVVPPPIVVAKPANITELQTKAPLDENNDTQMPSQNTGTETANPSAGSNVTASPSAAQTPSPAQTNTVEQAQPTASATSGSTTSAPATSNTTATQSAQSANQSSTSSANSNQPAATSTKTPQTEVSSAAKREAEAREKLKKRPEHNPLEWQ